MNEIAIEVKNLSKIYKLYNKKTDRLKEALLPSSKKYHTDHYALRDINFLIERGETVGIVGKNGSGKSTLLKIITGVLKSSSGQLAVNGKVSALLELGAGFNPEYTGIENIFLNGMMMGFSKEEIQEKIEEIIEFSELRDFIHQPVKSYSSGMFARLAFAVAINVEPDILIVDEALSVGDLYFQAKCITKMKELFQSGVTVLFVSHDINSVKALCKKTLYLEDGKMIAYGPSDEVVDLYAKKTRERMIKENYKLAQTAEVGKVFNITAMKQTNSLSFKESPEFVQKVSYYRQGTGDVQLVNLEVLCNESDVQIAKFNEEIKIRMHVKFLKSARVSVGYHIRDNKNIEIIGSNTLIEQIGELNGLAGDKVIVEFKTRVPLVEGIYNVSTVISTTTVHNRTAVFADYTENAYIFQVAENEEAKIWNKVYIENSVDIYRISEEG
ncbi:ABC transporter ATP-binding protein [Paenibacillus sp. 1P03SA]|uniref:ABC transporter ATP-binding protein n=1 Tax=Paenibacillus sp. 1P03SA TaxID=3132294 RepID=UPI0039A01520